MYQDFVTGLTDLMTGVLSPLLVSPVDLENMMAKMQRELNKKSLLFELAIEEPYDV